MTVRAIKPITITPAMVVESTLFETAPATYAAGTTYALGAYASVAGTLGEILIYKSLQAVNIGHTPASSPTWWVYSSSTYAVYSAATTYPIGYRVISTATHEVFESAFSENLNYALDNAPKWKEIPSDGLYDQTLPFYVSSATYTAGIVVISDDASAGDPNHIVWPVYKSKQSSNTGHGPDISPTWWQEVGVARPIYAHAATYALGEIISDGKGTYYESLVAGNTGQPLVGKIAWVSLGVNNATAMLDGEISTQSIASQEMTMTIHTGVIDTLALVGIEGGVVTVTVRNGLGGSVVYEQTKGISGEIVADWWAFLYGDASIPLRKVVFELLPPFTNGHVTIKISNTGDVKLGAIVAGVQTDIGIGASYGANLELKDYSVKTTDGFGETKFVRRGFKEVLELSIMVDKKNFNRIHNTLISLRSTPWFLIVADDPDLSEALYMYGFYNSYRNVIEYPTATVYSLQFESLVS